MSRDSSPAERNLLFGILALQNNLVDRAGLLDGFNRWIERKSIPIGEILVERGALGAGERDLLEALVEKYLEKFGGDPRKSLEALSSISSLREDLSRIADPDLQASLPHVLAGRSAGDDGDRTRTVPPDEQPGFALSRFRILRFHARGGLGQVSIALDRELDRQVALKEIQDHRADDPDSRARFVQEAEITGKLEHPGIVPVYGLGHDITGRPFYAMRFIKGDSLKEAIERFHADESLKKDPAERSARLRMLLRRFTDVCNAVAYAHSRGVLHRDLTPGNVMLGPYGETLVVDWGLAKPIVQATAGESASGDGPVLTDGPIRLSALSGSRDETDTGSIIGTPAYASPEQVAGRLDLLGPASDVYGLGAILYSLLTGQPPGQGKDRAEVRRRVERGEIPPPRSIDPTIPGPLEAICRKAMATGPRDRYPSGRSLAVDVERWLDDLPVSCHREHLLIRARRWVRKHRTAAAAAFSSMAVILVALGIARWIALRDEQEARREAVDNSLRILSVDADSVPSLVDSLGRRFARVAPILAVRWQDPDIEREAKLRVALALGSSEPGVAAYLESRVLDGDARTVRIVAERLRTLDPRAAIRQFWGLVEDPSASPPQRFRAACALAILDPPRSPDDRSRWARHIDWVVREALTTASLQGEEIDRTLSSLGDLYLRAVGRTCREGDTQRVAAYRLLRLHLERSNPQDFFTQARPAALILDAEPDDFDWLLKVLESNREQAIGSLSNAANDPDALFNDEPSMKGMFSENRRERALLALARLGQTDRLWPTLRRAAEPDLRTLVSRDMGRYGIDPALLIGRLHIEPDAGTRAALVLALGSYDWRRLDPVERQETRSLLLNWYVDDPDPGVHGTISWLLRTRWEATEMIRETDRRLVSKDPDPAKKRDWFVNGQGQAFAIVRGPKRFRMGSSTPAKPGEVRGDASHEREIPRSFAIATTEVTVAQYLEFVEAHRPLFTKIPIYNTRVSPERDSPIHGVQWFQAILYCRWLSEREKIPEDQMCFPPVRDLAQSLAQGKLELRSGRLDLTGYRLPSEAEWEFACRAGTTSPWFFGATTSRLLSEYALFLGNSGVSSPDEVESQGRTEPIGRLKPNDLGLFDVYGNVREWCLDALMPYPTAGGTVTDTTFLSPEKAGNWMRAVRGGSFADPLALTTSSHRNFVDADHQDLSLGFRVARTVP